MERKGNYNGNNKQYGGNTNGGYGGQQRRTGGGQGGQQHHSGGYSQGGYQNQQSTGGYGGQQQKKSYNNYNSGVGGAPRDHYNTYDKPQQQQHYGSKPQTASGYGGPGASAAGGYRKYSDHQEEPKKTPTHFPVQQQFGARSTAPSFEDTPPTSSRTGGSSTAFSSTESSGEKSRFGTKPMTGALMTLAGASAPTQGGGFQGTPCRLITNQYRLRLGQELQVFQYDVVIQPDHMSDTYIMQGIFRAIKRKVDAILGLYVTSGRCVYTTTDLDESIMISAEFRGISYEVIINVDSKTFISGRQIEGAAKMEDHVVMNTLLNIIVKQAFRETNLRQIGRQPRFFDVSKAVVVEGSGLQACPGFRAQAFNYTSGVAIVLDNINKFISNKTCLERIHEIMDTPEIKDKVSQIQKEFQFKSVIGAYGFKKTYIVEDIDFKKTPVTMRFDTHDGKKMSIAEYFHKTYDMKVTDLKQPLFVVKINGKECHIPPEFCTIDGVPQTIREDPRRMRDVLAACRKNPQQKFKAIQDFSRDLFSQKALKDWGIIIEAEPMQIQSQILPMPTIQLASGKSAPCDAQNMRNLPIQKPSEALLSERWAIVYESRHFNQANGVFEALQQASVKLNIRVEEPSWIEVQRGDDTFSCDKALKALIEAKKRPTIVLVMLGHERFYKSYKHVCYSLDIISQCIQFKNFGKGLNLSVASNILRQINSKLGGDLFTLKFTKELFERTMLIGIDVCHSGPNSIVGFCASINQARSQYYSERITQRKGQEIVNKQLKDAIKRSLGCFQEKHGDYPEHFIIYRDGVGDGMRRQVLQEEVNQLRQAITETYNMAKKKPCITVIIVNKRITQRFFVEDQSGRLINPPSGALIDTKIVENQDSQTEYDFYLVPQFTTQGCVLPTHFYVAFNDSPVDKAAIEKLTYDLCHYYFNWAGAIKVPAPCMYAHKIAELFTQLGKECRQIEFGDRIAQSLHYL